MRRLMVLAILLCAGLATAGEKSERVLLYDFDTPFRIQEKSPGSVTAEVKTDADGARRLELAFKRDAKSGMAYVQPAIQNVLATKGPLMSGLSFDAKGDGSKTFGLIEIRTDDYTNIFQAVFPLVSKEWTRIEIPWEEFFQINDNVKDAALDLAKVSNFSFGSRADWGSCAYAVRPLYLADVAVPESPKAPEGSAELAKTAAKLAAGEGIKIVALGDSITFGAQVSREGRKGGLYFQVAAAKLGEAFTGVKIQTVNAGVSGDTIAEGIIRIGHQVAAENPDLVIVLLGANDAIYEFPDARVRRTMSLLIDKLRGSTDAEILLLGPAPISDKPGIPERYGKVYADIAAEKGLAYSDTSKVFAGMPAGTYKGAFADNVHWSEGGHQAVGEAVGKYLTSLLTKQPE